MVFKFVEKYPDGSKVYRNQKQEEQFAAKFYDINFKNEYDECDLDSDKSMLKQNQPTVNAKSPALKKRDVTEIFKIRVVDSRRLTNSSISSLLIRHDLQLQTQIYLYKTACSSREASLKEA